MDDYEGSTSPEELAANLHNLVVGEVVDDIWQYAIDEYICWRESAEGEEYWMRLWERRRVVTQDDVTLLMEYCDLFPFLGTVEEKDIV